MAVDGKSWVEKEECSKVTNPSETNCTLGYAAHSNKECKFNSTSNQCEEIEKIIEQPSTTATTVPESSNSNNSKMLELSLAFISFLYL